LSQMAVSTSACRSTIHLYGIQMQIAHTCLC
jgi:hypothetical protein